MSNTTYAVMILVKLATYLLSFSHLPKITSPLFLSRIAHETALTKGAGLSSSNYLCTNFSLLLGLTDTDVLKLFFFFLFIIVKC